MDSVLHLLGIARKAGRVEVGEEPVGAAARARQAKLILVAGGAAENSDRRAGSLVACAIQQGRAGRCSGPQLLCHAGPDRYRAGLSAGRSSHRRRR